MYDYHQFLVQRLDNNNMWTNPDGTITNPGMIEFGGEVWFCYRAGMRHWEPTDIVIGVMDRKKWLPKKKFNKIKFPELGTRGYTLEDPRLFIYDGRLHISAAIIKYDPATHEIKWIRQCIIEYSTLELKIIQHSEIKQKAEKNWIFFNYDGELYCSYSIFDQRHDVCRVVDNLAYPAYYTSYRCARWQRGNVMRGTSNLVLKDGLLWGVAHTSVDSDWWTTKYSRDLGLVASYLSECSHVVIGKQRSRGTKAIHFQGVFYAMNSKPPFGIVYMQRGGMLAVPDLKTSIGKHVFYPSGLILDGDDWIVAAGINDFKTAILRVPHSKVMEYLFQTSWYP